MPTEADKWRRAEVGAAVVIAIFTIVLSVVSYFQYDAARKAARRSMQANQIAKRALNAVQRAFVYNTEIDVSATGAKPPPGFTIEDFNMLNVVALQPLFENGGDTPARQMTHIDTYCVTNGAVPDDVPTQFNFSYPSGLAISPSVIVPPKGHQTGLLPIWMSDLDDVVHKKAALFVWGTINYKDVFGDSHTTQYCQQLGAFGVNTSTNQPMYVFRFCKYHNCDDESCPKEWGTGSLSCRAVPVLK